MSAGGAGGRAIRRSIERFYGRGDVVDNYIYDGKTDPQIFIELLRRFKDASEIDDGQIAKLLDSYIELLPQELAKNTAFLYPGVKPLLRALRDRQLPFGLLTGNLERGAKLKLEHVGIRHEFKFRPIHQAETIGVCAEIRIQTHPFGRKKLYPEFPSRHLVAFIFALGIMRVYFDYDFFGHAYPLLFFNSSFTAFTICALSRR